MCAPQNNSTAGWTGLADEETSQAPVSQASKGTQFFNINITLGSWRGKQDSHLFHSAPRGSHAKEPQALDLCSNQINLQCFDFKRRLLCRPNTTGLLGAQRGQDVHLEARQAQSTIQAEKKKNKEGSGHNEQQNLFPSIFLGLGTTVNMEHESQQQRPRSPSDSFPPLLHRRDFGCPSPLYFLFVCLV